MTKWEQADDIIETAMSEYGFGIISKEKYYALFAEADELQKDAVRTARGEL